MSDGRRSKWNCIIRRGHDLAAFWNGLPLIFFFRCCPVPVAVALSTRGTHHFFAVVFHVPALIQYNLPMFGLPSVSCLLSRP
ncbi:hypothetical protein BX666DRAFT_1543336 [Dichotomocladium elegans]|nr:hypothetical protein BX666DRAFT_1543336 [Dichotomocladium elegans]